LLGRNGGRGGDYCHLECNVYSFIFLEFPPQDLSRTFDLSYFISRENKLKIKRSKKSHKGCGIGVRGL